MVPSLDDGQLRSRIWSLKSLMEGDRSEYEAFFKQTRETLSAVMKTCRIATFKTFNLHCPNFEPKVNESCLVEVKEKRFKYGYKDKNSRCPVHHKPVMKGPPLLFTLASGLFMHQNNCDQSFTVEIHLYFYFIIFIFASTDIVNEEDFKKVIEDHKRDKDQHKWPMKVKGHLVAMTEGVPVILEYLDSKLSLKVAEGVKTFIKHGCKQTWTTSSMSYPAMNVLSPPLSTLPLKKQKQRRLVTSTRPPFHFLWTLNQSLPRKY